MFQINRVAKNLFSTGFGSIISQILVFLTGAYYAQIIGTESFGVVSLVQIYIMYFTAVTLFGLQTYGTREVSKGLKDTGNILGDIIGFRCYIALVSFIILALLSFTLKMHSGFGSLMLLYSITLFPIALNLDWFFNGIQEMKHNAIFNIIKNLVPFLIIIIYLKSSKDILLIPISTLVGICAAIAYQWIVIRSKNSLSINFNFSIRNFKNYFVIGVPFVLSGVFSMLNNYVDRVIMGFSRTSSEVGIYSAAYFIIMFLINIIAITFTPIFPLMIKYFHEKNEKLDIINNLTAKFVMIISVPLAAGGILLSKEIITLLFGKEYFEAFRPLRILMVYILILFIREIFGYQLNAWGRERLYLKIIFTTTAFNVGLNLLFTPKFGMISAAYITLFCETFNFYLMYISAQSIMRTKLLSNINGIVIPVIVMSLFIIVLKYFSVNIFVIIFFSVAVYFSALILAKGLRKSDLALFIRNRSEF